MVPSVIRPAYDRPETAFGGAALRVRRISPADLVHCLKAGVADFLRHPSQLIFLALIYPIVGLFLARLSFGYDVLPLLFPLVAGFALLGPLTAVGLYELSRRREAGLPAGWDHVFALAHAPTILSIAVIGCALVATFLLWLLAALVIYELTLGGYVPASLASFAQEVFGTRAGWALIVFGNGVGLVFAVFAMSLSVVSLPLLVDRDVSTATAVRTSFSAVAANPAVMALWGLIVAALLALGALPFFVGLAVVLPILGHATWHLYRRLVV
ncbi:DUF2189 domain-containing protein [Xanthobacter sp. KR7-225]|uniref:DUF2189 domain-containing protein n=1 Tax=Xanthobacter sp. KR7-225 TaxID=3156613 RepID=UPI0032B506E5